MTASPSGADTGRIPFISLVPFLLSALFHFQLNNPIWPDAQPYDTFAFVAAAILVVWIKRETMFRREGGFTRVIPEALD